MILGERLGRWLLRGASERRDMSVWAPPFAGSRSSPRRTGAENAATLCACVDTIASAIGAFPAIVFEVLPDGNRRERPRS